MGFRFMPIGVEELRFKRIPDGWLFTTVDPRMFFRSKTYVVGDAQKPALAAQVRRILYMRVIGQQVAILLLILACPWLISQSLKAWAAFGASAVVVCQAMALVEYIGIRRHLREATPTSQRIRAADTLQTAIKSISVRALALFTVLDLFAALACLTSALQDGQSNDWTMAVIFTLSGLLSGGLLSAKLRARRLADIDRNRILKIDGATIVGRSRADPARLEQRPLLRTCSDLKR